MIEGPKITSHFFWKEVYCKCGKCGEMPKSVNFNVQMFAKVLEKVRKTVNKLAAKYDLNLGEIHLIITSWYRCYDKNSAHSTGLAVDIACENNIMRFLITSAAIKCGITRIGEYVPNQNRKIIHLDIDDTDLQKRPLYQLWVEA